MSPVESAQLTELTNELRAFRSEFAVVKTKLFGDDETEDAQGRIPRIEAAIMNQDKRIGRIERETWIARGAALLLAIAAGVVEFIYHVTAIVRH